MANLSIGDTAPDFKLPAVSGTEIALSDFHDRTGTVVIFSCNHCPYVQAWERRMVDIQEDYANDGIQFIAVNANDPEKYPEDSFENMKQRALDRNFNFPYVQDETQEVARAYGAERTPEVYHGAIDDNYQDRTEVENHYLRDALDALVEGGSPPVAETQPVGCSVKYRD